MQGGDPARLALWVTGDGVVCEVHDDGPGVADLLAGSLPPRSENPSRGTGLWIARQLCDTLAIGSGPARTTVGLAISA